MAKSFVMKFRRVFVRIDDDNCSVTYLKRGEVGAALASGVSASSGGVSASSGDAAGGEIAVKVSTYPGEVSGFLNSRYFYPACEVGVKVPDEDLQLVKTWLSHLFYVCFGERDSCQADDYGCIGGVQAIQGAGFASEYAHFSLCGGLCVAPHGWFACQGVSFCEEVGKYSCAAAPANEISLTGTSLQTVMEIMNTPVSLKLDVEPFSLDEGLAASVTHLDIYMGMPVDLLAGDEQVTAIRSAEIAGERRKIWHYQRLDEDIILSRLGTTTDFRVVASIPISEAMSGVKGMSLPGAGVSFGSWDKIGKLESDAKPGDVEKPEEHYEHKRIVTSYLDLGDMDATKRVRGITARGVFARRDMKMELLGSHHRDKWRVVGRCSGPHMRLLRGVGYRWWQVRVLMDADGTLDGINFLMNS